MADKVMYIPKKIIVGFQKRNDTFTGKLAYITYFDEKGVHRKKTSWDGWRDHKIETIELDNTPRSGFVINKGVARDGYWGSGRSVVRIHDPEEFEFEIDIPNLIGILMHSDVSKRDITQDCVYAWYGTSLVLLPTNSKEYQDSLVYTKKQEQKVSAKELKVGATYVARKHDTQYVYIGRYDWFDWTTEYERSNYYRDRFITFDGSKVDARVHGLSGSVSVPKGKKHVFYNVGSRKFEVPSVSTLAYCVNEECVSDYATLVDQMWRTANLQQVTGVTFAPITRELIYKWAKMAQYGKFKQLSVVKILSELPHVGRPNPFNQIEGCVFYQQHNISPDRLLLTGYGVDRNKAITLDVSGSFYTTGTTSGGKFFDYQMEVARTSDRYSYHNNSVAPNLQFPYEYKSSGLHCLTGADEAWNNVSRDSQYSSVYSKDTPFLDQSPIDDFVDRVYNILSSQGFQVAKYNFKDGSLMYSTDELNFDDVEFNH